VLTPEGHVIRPTDGKLILPYMGARMGCGTPIPLGNRVLISGALYEFSMNGPDKLTARKVSDVMAPGNLGGPAYSNGVVYSGYRGTGTRVEAATTVSAPTAVRLYGACEAATGRVVYRDIPGPAIDETPEWPAPAVASKYLFFSTLNGIDVADISLGRPWPLAANRNERSHTGPVFDGERMYLRTYDAITCIARKGEEGARYEREVNARTVIAAFPKEIGKRAITEVKPVADVRAWVGGPVTMYAPGKPITQWLFAGPFPREDGKDVLDSLGGAAKAQPEAGAKVTFGGATCAFAPVDARYLTPKGLDADGPTRKDRAGQSVFFAWLLIGRTEYVIWNPCKPGVRAWVGAQEVGANQVLKLGTGAYPVLLHVQLPVDYVEAPVVVDVTFAASEDPAETRKRDIALVRAGRPYLQLVIDALPGSDEAKQAAALLRAAE
jgi:hypothetical protein